MGILPDNPKSQLLRSKFRIRFRLTCEDHEYISRIGLSKVQSHAYDFITERLAAAYPQKDGKQTPFKGHPVFKAQHATATCCRGCLSKWYKINKGSELSPEIVVGIVNVIMEWIQEQLPQESKREFLDFRVVSSPAGRYNEKAYLGHQSR